MYPPLDVGLGRSLPDVVLNAGIDQDVEAPEFFSDLYRQMVDAFGVGHVELLCDNAAPNLRGQCPRGGLAFLRILGTKNHGVTEPFQLPNPSYPIPRLSPLTSAISSRGRPDAIRLNTPATNWLLT